MRLFQAIYHYGAPPKPVGMVLEYLADAEDITVDISVLNYPDGRPAES